MSTTEPAVNRLATNAQMSTSGNYEADLARMRADLNTLLGTKLISQLIINPDLFDLINSYHKFQILCFKHFKHEFRILNFVILQIRVVNGQLKLKKYYYCQIDTINN